MANANISWRFWPRWSAWLQNTQLQWVVFYSGDAFVQNACIIARGVPVGSAMLTPSSARHTHDSWYTPVHVHTHTHSTQALYGYPCWHVSMDSYCMDAHTFQTDSSANDVFAPSSSCLLSVTVPGVSTTTTFPCWRPPEPSKACRSSRKCRSLRKLQQSHSQAFAMT